MSLSRFKSLANQNPSQFLLILSNPGLKWNELVPFAHLADYKDLIKWPLTVQEI
jgi:hypothetical protein